MNKNAKRRLSSFLAFTLFLSSMTVNNVSIYAEDEAGLPDGFALTDVDEAVSEEALDFSTFSVEEDAPISAYTVEGDTFMSDEAVAEGTVIIDNEYATVYAGQNLQWQESDVFETGGIENKDFGDVVFKSKVRTSGVNTKATQTNAANDPATGAGTAKLSSNQRVAYKVVSKKPCKITAYASGGTHVLWLDSGTAESPNITLGSTSNGDATILGYTSGIDSVSADIDENQVAYFSGQGTNDNFLGIRVEKGSEPIQPTVTLTLDGEPITSAQDVEVSGFKFNSDSTSTNSTGMYTFNGLATYDYTITAKKDGVTYQGVFKAEADGSYSNTLDLQVIAAEAGIYLVDEGSNPIVGAKVTLDYFEGLTPKKAVAVTDAAGYASFDALVFGDYDVTVDGYDTKGYIFSPQKGALTDTVSFSEAKLTALPESAAVGDGNVYVGFAKNDSYTDPIYFSVQEAVDAAAEGSNVIIASGLYHEMVTIKKSLNLIGYGDDKPIIEYNDSQQGNDDNGKTRFHGDTLSIQAAEAVVRLENLVIENSAEDTNAAIVQNATALSSCYDSSNNNIVVSDCDIVATRDTIYTGKANCTDQWTFEGCAIYGFQDVVCGGGSANLIDCDWVLNMNSDARLLVPQCRTDGNITFMTAKNLNVVQADYFVKSETSGASFTKNAYLGRPWGNGSAASSTTQCIVEGVTDETGIVPETAYNGFDADNGLSAAGGLDAADWLVCVGEADGEHYYATTYRLDVNKVDKSKTEKVDGGVLVAGAFNKELLGVADSVGYAIFDTDGNFIGVAESSTVYKVKGGDGTMYSVSYVEGLEKFRVKAFAEIDGHRYIYGANNATVSV